MATFTWKNAASGLWGNDALWAGGIAPNDALADVSLSPAGPYTVTLAAGTKVATRTVAAVIGVTLDIAGSLSIAGTSSLASVIVQPSGRLSGQGTIDVGATLTNNGVISSDVASSSLWLTTGTFTNTGTLAADGTGTYLFLANANLTNLVGGTLTGGTYTATGQPLGGSVATIDIARSGISTEITTLQATVILRYINATIQGRTDTDAVRALETTLSTIGAAGDLQIRGGRNYTTSQALSIGGRMVIDGGTLKAGGLSVVTGGTLAGFGTVASPLALAGTLHAQNGTLTLGGGLTGSGTVTVDAGARLRLAGGSYDASFGGFGIVEATSGSVVLTAPLSGALQLRVVAGTTLDVGAALDLGAAGASTMVFGGANARLAFGVAGGFSGIIAGFQTTDVLELKNIAATSASAAPAGLNSLLTLTTASGSVTLRLAGDYSGKSFAVAPDGKGGTNVTVAGVTHLPGVANWATSALTWSLATSNYASQVPLFSTFVDPTGQAALASLWRAAFARWEAVSGLHLVEIADTPNATGQADIRVGWGNFGNPPLGEIGNASASYLAATQKFNPGAIVRLQDPAVTPVSSSGGVLLYQGMSASAYQVMLHEIGHALGLDHAISATDPAAVMAPVATAANRDLDISDIAGIRALYAGLAAPIASALAVAISPAGVKEDQPGGSGFAFSVTRDGDISGSASVAWALTGSGVNPANAADFNPAVLPSGTVTLAPGVSGAVVSIPVAVDSIVEPDEGFTVTLSNPTGATIAAATADGIILNDDITTVAIAATDATKPEGIAGNTSSFSFSVTRSDAGLGAIALGYAVTPGALRSANGADFVGGTLPTGTVSFGVGQTKATITVAVQGDDIAEANETFVVTLNTPPATVLLGTASATGTILADEPIADLAPVLAGGKAVASSPVYYTGPVAGLEKELILLSAENLNIAVAGPNWFLHSGSGTDALSAASGTNVLDGGTGSNFLTGGTGADTFFIDARSATQPIWNTVYKFQSGDAVTFWGVSTSTHSFTWLDDQGAEEYKGLTLHASGVGVPTASLTLPLYDLARKNSALTVLFGFDPGSKSDYLYVLAN